MILKKPYAFLVKHFRMIHAFILACSIFIFLKFNSIVDFFNNYLGNNLKISGIDDVASKYIDGTLTFLLVIILIITSVVMSLMIYKKKPKLFYIYVITIYLAILILTFYLSGFLYDIQFETPSVRTVQVIRDISFTILMLQIPIMIMTFIRTIGFDLKKFDFKRDLLDLGVEEEDNEEYVVDFNIDSDDIKSNIRKRIRYLGYYYKENKLIFTVIGGVFLGILLLMGIIHLATQEKIYREGETFTTNFFRAEVLNSYKTNTDATGNGLSQNNFYLILKIRYTNTYNEPYTMHTSNALLDYNGVNTIAPTMKMSKDFTEFGVNYYTQTLMPHETREFVLVYEIPNEYYNSTFKLKYLYNQKVVKGEVKYQYRTVKLSPKTFSDQVKSYKPKEIGQFITLEDSLLGNTKIRINEIKFNNSFYYTTVKCKKGKCSNIVKQLKAAPNTKFDMTLMRVDYDVEFDYDTLGKGYINNDIISKYGSIRFEIDGKEYNNRLKLTSVTPYGTGKYEFVEVRSKVRSADKVYLDLTIRDKIYTIILVDKSKTEKVENSE